MNEDPHIILRGDALVEHIANTATAEVLSRITEGNDRERRRTMIIWSLIGFIGFSGIVGAAKLYINSEISSAVAKYSRDSDAHFKNQLDRTVTVAVNAAITKGTSELTRQLEAERLLDDLYAAANELTSASKDRSASGNAIRDEIMVILRKIAVHPDILQRSKFRSSLSSILEPFILARLSTQIEEIESLFLAQTTFGIETVLNLADHHGENLSTLSPRSAEYSACASKLRRYAQLSIDGKYPEKALFWDIVCQIKESEMTRTRHLDDLVGRIELLEPLDKQNFFKMIEVYSDPTKWQNRIGPTGIAMKKVIEELRRLYPILASTAV